MTLMERDGPAVHHCSPTMPSKSHAPLLLDLHPTAVAPELWSPAAIPLAFLETIERIEINDARVSDDDGESYFVLDVFLHHFDTRLPANLSSLRRRASSGAKVKRRSPTTTTTRGSTPDYRVERKLSDFIKLRRRIHQVAGLTPYIRCASCEAFSAATMHLLSVVFQETRKEILAAFIGEVTAMAQCKEKQNRKCESHGLVMFFLEWFLREPQEDTESSFSSSRRSSHHDLMVRVPLTNIGGSHAVGLCSVITLYRKTKPSPSIAQSAELLTKLTTSKPKQPTKATRPARVMGLLVEGSPLDWDDALDWLEHVRSHGIDQFLHIYKRVKDIEGDVLKWGDELEYGVFKMDARARVPRLSLRGAEILAQLREKEEKFKDSDQNSDGCNWVPEYGAWMIEGTPSVPYGGFTSDLRKVEGNMRLRRARLLELLHEDEIAPTVTAFPMMGVKDFTFPHTEPLGPVAMSSYVSDAVINPHPRFATLTRNIRKRRTRKVDIRVPLFKDVHTKAMLLEEKATWNAEKSRPQYESKRVLSDDESASTGNSSSDSFSPTATGASAAAGSKNGDEAAMSKSPTSQAFAAFDHDDDHSLPSRRKISISHAVEQAEPYPGFIHMDCMAFGMGMCCLQVTFQAKNIGESRHLYDHLSVLSPILLALTAATPILKGRLADTDVRWATISAAVDDRTPQELGIADLPTDKETQAKYAKMAGNGAKRLPKSRYEGISTYICNHKDGEDPHSSSDKYNDVDVPYDEKSFETLSANGVDRLLALHISHLFIRDPLVIYQQRLHLDDASETDHFENIQSTNWQTVRWKPPPPAHVDADGEQTSPHIGWRTEFRSMEIQLTDFENAAFTVFIALLSRVILTFDLNLYIPLSRVNENMEAAHRVNAVVDEKFYFRCHLAPPEKGDCSSGSSSCDLHEDPDRCEPMTIAEIMLGKGTYFTGLIPIVYAYLDYIECDDATRKVVHQYLCLIAKRATGELPTAATWMRRFVCAHPDYAHDSVVSSSIAFDLLKECQDIGEGVKQCPELLGEFKIEPVRGGAAYQVPLKSEGVEASMRQKLLERYMGRTTAGSVCSTCK